MTNCHDASRKILKNSFNFRRKRPLSMKSIKIYPGWNEDHNLFILWIWNIFLESLDHLITENLTKRRDKKREQERVKTHDPSCLFASDFESELRSSFLQDENVTSLRSLHGLSTSIQVRAVGKIERAHDGRHSGSRCRHCTDTELEGRMVGLVVVDDHVIVTRSYVWNIVIYILRSPYPYYVW